MIKGLLLSLMILFSVDAMAQQQSAMGGFENVSQSIKDVSKALSASSESLLNGDFGGAITKEDLYEIYDEFNAYAAEALTVSIMMLPKIYWQYVVPALYVTPLIPEEVLNNPEFLPYKGKKPTLIEPTKQKFADKYLDDLHPALYTYLIPNKMPGEEADKQESFADSIINYTDKLPQEFPEKIFLEDQPSSKIVDLAFMDEPSEKYASGAYLNEKPDTERAKEITETSTLRGGDVLAFLDTLPKASLIAEKDAQLKLDPKGNIKDMLQTMVSSMMENPPKNPCQNFVSSLDAKLAIGFELLLKEYRFDRKSWGIVCDSTIKAYRLRDVDMAKLDAVLDMAMKKNALDSNLNKYSSQAKEIIAKRIEAMEDLYSGKPEDINAVKWYMDDISKAFQKSGFLNHLRTSL